MEAKRNDTALAGSPYAGVLASAQAPAPDAEQQRLERRRILLARTRTSGPQPRRRYCPFAVVAITSNSMTSLSLLVHPDHAVRLGTGYSETAG
jgi:hypothetical protein